MYVLEQAAPFIKAHGLAAGDAVGVCTNGSGALTILANTPEVEQPTCDGCSCFVAPPANCCLASQQNLSHSRIGSPQHMS